MQKLSQFIGKVKHLNFPYFHLDDLPEVWYSGRTDLIWFVAVGCSFKHGCIEKKVSFNAWNLEEAIVDGQEASHLPLTFNKAQLTFKESKYGNVITVNAEENCKNGHSLLNGEHMFGWG